MFVIIFILQLILIPLIIAIVFRWLKIKEVFLTYVFVLILTVIYIYILKASIHHSEVHSHNQDDGEGYAIAELLLDSLLITIPVISLFIQFIFNLIFLRKKAKSQSI